MTAPRNTRNPCVECFRPGQRCTCRDNFVAMLIAIPAALAFIAAPFLLAWMLS